MRYGKEVIKVGSRGIITAMAIKEIQTSRQAEMLVRQEGSERRPSHHAIHCRRTPPVKVEAAGTPVNVGGEGGGGMV
jgi:hypothetical protein